jgi:hypothetical protein
MAGVMAATVNAPLAITCKIASGIDFIRNFM